MEGLVYTIVKLIIDVIHIGMIDIGVKCARKSSLIRGENLYPLMGFFCFRKKIKKVFAKTEFLPPLCRASNIRRIFLHKREEVNQMMKTDDYQTAIEREFDCYCKKILRNYARDIHRMKSRRNINIISIEAMSFEELSQLCVWDDYETDYIFVTALGPEARITDIRLAKAIEALSKRKQEIIRLSFFKDMKNKEIAELLGLSVSTVSEHKRKALAEMKIFMEEYANENQAGDSAICPYCSGSKRKR